MGTEMAKATRMNLKSHSGCDIFQYIASYISNLSLATILNKSSSCFISLHESEQSVLL